MMEKTQAFLNVRTGSRLALVALSLIGLAFAVNAQRAGQRPGQLPQQHPDRPIIRERVYVKLAEADSCIEVLDFGCARERLDELIAMHLNNYETAQYWNLLAYIQYAEGDATGAAMSYENLLMLSGLPTRMRETALRALEQLYEQSGQQQI